MNAFITRICTIHFSVHGKVVLPPKIFMHVLQKVNKILTFLIWRHSMIWNLCQKSKKIAEIRIPAISFFTKI